MFGIMVGIIIYSMIITAFLFIPVMFIYRVYLSVKNINDLKQRLLIILVPFSLGYYLYFPNSLKPKLYSKLMTMFFILSLIGISFTLFQIIIPSYT